MPAQQQQINYGNTANDGQGDPLRTAFIKVDDNFDAVWAAGPVGSNVTVLNNTVGTVTANGNLIITANGVGVIQTNSSLVPRFANSYDLGSATLRYRALFVGTGGATISGNITAARLQNDANLVIRSNAAGTAKNWTFDTLGDLNLPVGGNISGSGYVTAQRVITDPLPLANLAAVSGARAFASDGNLAAAGNFGANVSGGGANVVPVWSDGSNWYIG